MSYPRQRRSRQSKSARRTSGNINLTGSTTWANVDTGIDITLKECQVGDQVLAGVSGVWGNENVVAWLDVVTVVSGSPVNSFAVRGAAVTTPSSGVVGAWYGTAAAFTAISGTAPPYTLVIGDISSGSVTFRLRYAMASATARNLLAATDYPFDWWVENVGPVQA